MVDASAPDPAPAFLPPGNRFVGRAAELGRLRRLLTADGTRLVTLTGPGGVGKTRLALEAGRRAEADFPDGVLMVPLVPLARPGLILPAVARARGIRGAEEQLATLLRDELAGRRVLLLLDNLEHLLPGAAPPLAWLLDACPRLTVLATSRRPTHLRQECTVPVEPFPMDPRPVDDASAAASDAVRLFVARAIEAYPRFRLRPGDAATVAALCARVDGLPLAIELLAGWIVLLSPAQMLAQLARRLEARTPTDDPRHRTMRDAIAWSEVLLTAEQRALFRRLAVCAGGFTLDLAERLARGRPAGAGYPFADGYGLPWKWREVADPTIPPGDAQDPAVARPLPPIPIDVVKGLAALLDHGLVRRTEGADGEPRFELLETIRAFGVERLAEEGELPATRHAHAAAMAAFCEATGEGLWYAERRLWSRARIDQELPNIRAALAWATDRGPAGAELAIRLAGPLGIYWQTHGLVTEGRAWLEAALRHPTSPPWCRATLLPTLGFLCWIQGDDARATEVLTEALGVTADVGCISWQGSTHFFLALVAWHKLALSEMVARLEEAERLYREAEDPIGLGTCRLAFGLVARVVGDAEQALARFDEAHRFHQEARYEWGIATSRYLAGEVHGALAAEDPSHRSRAVALLHEALREYWAQGDLWGAGCAVSALARVAPERGDDARAARLFGAADAMLARVGGSLLPTERATQQEAAEAVRGRMERAAYEHAYGAGQAMTPADAVAEVLAQGQGGLAAADPWAGLTRMQRALLRQVRTHFPDGREFTVKALVAARGGSDSAVYAMLAEIARRLGLAHWREVIPWATASGSSSAPGAKNPEN